MANEFVQSLHHLLQQSTSPDTVAIKAATTTLNKQFWKNPQCIPALTSIIQSSPEQPVRQLAAVELRKRINASKLNLWAEVSQADREQIKSTLLPATMQEPVAIVRHSIARVIASIAVIELPASTWPELLPFLNQACTSAVSGQREVGIYILYAVLDGVTEGFQQHIPSLFTLFGGLLADPESLEVRVTTVRALGTIAQWLDADEKPLIASFQALIPSILTVTAQAVEAENEEYCRQIFDIIETLLILEIPLLSKHVPQLIEYTVAAGGNRNVPDELRVLALNALNWTVQYKKTRIQNQALAPNILRGLMPIGTEPEPEDIDDDAPSRSALRIIDALATSLPPSQVFPALRQLVTEYMSSPDPNYRRCAMMALGVSIEGCSEFMAPHMDQVWPVIEAGLQDQDATVRKAACTCVGCVCEWLEDDVISRHQVLVPAVLSLIDQPITQPAACTALDALLEILGTVIDQYLDPIMTRLILMLDTTPIKTKSVITGAIGSAAHASKEKFAPYFEPTIQKLSPHLQLTNEGEEIELRGITVDAIGTFAEAVGKDAFRPYFAEMMKQAFLGIELGSARLRECSFLFFGVMSRVFEEEFAIYLPTVVPALLSSLKQLEHGEIGEEELKQSVEAFDSSSQADTSSASIDITEIASDLEDLDVDKLLEVNSAIAVEKEIAADTFGALFLSTRNHFLPFVESATVELLALLEHYYEGIRKSAVESLLEFIRVFYELSDPVDWEQGAASAVPLNPRVKDLINHVLPALLNMVETEDNKSVVSSLCVGIAETLQKVGPGFVENKLEEIGNLVKSILENKAMCQQDPDQDDEDPAGAEEDQAEFDSVLISSAGDVVAAMAATLGRDFVGALEVFYPLIAKYYKKKRSLSDRSSAVGTIAEIISGMKGAITPFTDRILQLVLKALSDEDAEVHSNASFAIGLLVENTEVDLSSQYPTILTALQHHFQLAPDAPSAKLNARDNAAGAVARLITRNVAALPLDKVLPVLFGVLPLRNDLLENRPIFKAIFYLFRVNPQAMSPYIDQLLPVFAHVLDPNGGDQLGDEGRAELIQLVAALNAELPGKVQAAGLGAYL
ncbi:ARM repeat-containing protein [Sistotremastrum niveocremeum HHB9708]|uniref:ARM repeat-containing protein n=1 Tax=Sistotremastrum niveocremeum HHB9708 TaxID=1314777 RepID=A0A164NQ59_9AGAM|nr:ARM repeat-containing protein [Sistotremastrum niveocremeum HHB9708]